MYTYQTNTLPPRDPQPKKKNWLPWLIAGGAAAIGTLVLLTVVIGIGVFYLMQERIPEGVTIAGLSVGDETVEDATTTLNSYLAQQSWTITVTDEDRQWPVALADLGITVDKAAMLNAAQNATENTAIDVQYAIDFNAAQAGLMNLSDQANIDAIPGRPGQIGRAIDIPMVLDRLRQNLNGELADGLLDLSMIIIEPPEISALEAYTGARTTHIVERGQELALIARQYGVAMEDIVALNEISDPNLLFVGQELIIPADGLYQPSAENAPPAPLAQGKAIVVSTEDQRIYAYENGQLIRSHLTSTGTSATPTVKGDYNIYVKFVEDDMSGADYFLPDVPYTMYFYQGYGIHGTYWHNSFGRPMSHGCVNLPVEEAKWFFEWAEVGTLVRVI